MRGQYYWHRFFYHQPDLNYENPLVQDSMLEVLRFWLDLGIDGFGSTVPAACMCAGAPSCENLGDARIPEAGQDRSGPALRTACCWRASQWPDDVVGTSATGVSGDECHMAFHFR